MKYYVVIAARKKKLEFLFGLCFLYEVFMGFYVGRNRKKGSDCLGSFAGNYCLLRYV